MADASARDQLAWKLAGSSKPLWTAFQDNRKADQYGGLLFLSALIYRLVGGPNHYPLLLMVLAAAFSALAVLFTWAFARRLWGGKEAWLAAWIMALYPEAVLLGSSQMREAFTMTLTVVPFYGLLRYQQDRSRLGLIWMLAPLLLCLPFSPPFAAFLTVLLALAAFVTSGSFGHQILRQRRLWLILGAVILLAGVGLWLAVRQFAPDGMTNPFEVVAWWIKKSAGLQAYLSQHASGWMQKVFKQTPEGLHMPLLLGYGVVQPFLPAALMVGSKAAIWPWVTFFRAVGWSLMLLFLIYAPLLALRKKEKHHFTLAIILIVWIGILVASFRGGGDLWDNPRYRAAFAGLQAGVVAWTWMEQRRTGDPWLRRALIAAAAIVAWFLPWYWRRYSAFTWPVVDLFKTIGLGVASAVLLNLWDWARKAAVRLPDRRSDIRPQQKV
jgi:hypothetical protein